MGFLGRGGGGESANFIFMGAGIFPVVSNLVVCNFYAEALFCARLHSFASKVPEGHHPRGTTLREVSEEICLSRSRGNGVRKNGVRNP